MAQPEDLNGTAVTRASTGLFDIVTKFKEVMQGSSWCRKDEAGREKQGGKVQSEISSFNSKAASQRRHSH